MNFCHISQALLGCAIIVAAFATPVQAQTQFSAQPDELQAVYACKTISRADERLACYDRTVGRFEAAEKSGEVVTVSKTAIEKVEKDAFGFNIPSLPSLGRIFGGEKESKTPKKENALTAPVKQASRTVTSPEPSKPPAINPKPLPSKIKNVTLDIRKVSEFGYKKNRFFMTNGQVWEQIGTVKVRIPKVKNGKLNKAEIRKAAAGSFLLQINSSGAAIRVKRVR